MGGYYQFERNILHSDRYKTLPTNHRLILHDILIEMNYKDEEVTLFDGRVITVHAGQLFTTIRQMVYLSGASENTVRRSLAFFSQSGFVRVERVGKYLILTPNVAYILGKEEVVAEDSETAQDAISLTETPSQTLPESYPESCSKSYPKSYPKSTPEWKDFLIIKNKKNIRIGEGEKAPAPASKRANPSVAKKSYAEHGTVKLTEEEYRYLASQYPDVGEKIQHLENYMRENGKHYANHFAVLLRWAKEDAKQARERPTIPAMGSASKRNRRRRRNTCAYAREDTRMSPEEEKAWIQQKLEASRKVMFGSLAQIGIFPEEGTDEGIGKKAPAFSMG